MRRWVALLLVLLTTLTAVWAWETKASAESLYIRKIVSVVYDDSGSMRGEKHAYANYAMQAFCGMLNSEDRLFITKMSDSICRTVDLSASGIQSSVDAIRKYGTPGNTPFGAVKVAFDKLKSVQDDNPNTQYWLVVITDGNFTSGTDGTGKHFLNQKMQEYTQTPMPNGSYPQVNFLAIGDNVVAPDKNEGQGIFVYPDPDQQGTDNTQSDAEQIISLMSDIADRISGRTRLKTEDMQQLDDRTIQVSSSIPLLNIAVLAQGSAAKISRASDHAGTAIPISRSASLRCPDASYTNLVGSAYLLGDSQDVIEAGTYIITFDQSISLSDVVVLYEPALEVRVSITVNGQQITDLKQLEDAQEGDKISVCYDIYEMGTDHKVDPALLPNNTQYEAVIKENGKVVASADGNRQINDYELKNTETEIRVAVTIAGFNPITYSTRFTPKKFVLYTVTAEYGGSTNTVHYDNIGGSHDLTICFRVYGNGVPVTDPDVVKSLAPNITVSPQGNSGSVEYASDGRIIFTPNATQKPDHCYDQYTVQVTCSLSNGGFARKDYTVILPQYTVSAQPIPQQTVKFEEIAQNQTVSIRFVVYKDGQAVLDPQQVKALQPTITVSPSGNDGTVRYDTDGTIVFTPNVAVKPEGCQDQYDVTVQCTLVQGATAQGSYTVILPQYTLEATFAGPVQSIQYDALLQNKDLAICFTVYKDGQVVTDVEQVKALLPTVQASPAGNDGVTTYTADGKILFTPNAAAIPEAGVAQFDVTVTCTIAGGISASATYTVEMPVYTLEVSYGGPAQSVKFDEIAGNTDMTLVFTVYKDGVAITDSNTVKALNPVFAASPNGNSGIVTVTEDGKLVYTPNAASLPVAHDGHFPVEVTCTIRGGISATGSYTVLIAEYKVIPIPTDASIVKTRFYGNEIGASFYITKDGVSMRGAEIVRQFTVAFNREHKNLQWRVEVSEDGIITVIPYSDKDRPMHFWNWIRNARYYWFSLTGKDVQITLSHPVGHAENTLDVCGESASYIWWNVIMPLLLNLAALWWILAIVFKPKYARNAVLCVGKITYDANRGVHVITGFRPVKLKKYNKFFVWKNYRWVPWFAAQKVKAKGLVFRAKYFGDIAYEMNRPWFKVQDLQPGSSSQLDAGNFESVRSYCANHNSLEVAQIAMPEAMPVQQGNILSPVSEQQVRGFMICPGTLRDDGGLLTGWIFNYYEIN